MSIFLILDLEILLAFYKLSSFINVTVDTHLYFISL